MRLQEPRGDFGEIHEGDGIIEIFGQLLPTSAALCIDPSEDNLLELGDQVDGRIARRNSSSGFKHRSRIDDVEGLAFDLEGVLYVVRHVDVQVTGNSLLVNR